MSDNIAKINGEDAYAGRVPAWHGKGTTVGHNMTAQEAIAAAHLNWPVAIEPIYTRTGVRIPDSFISVRGDMPESDPDRIFGVVGPRFRPVQNKAAFTFFDTVIENGEAVYTSVGALGKGERVFIVAELPVDYWVAEDQYKSYVVLTNGHDGKHGLSVLATSVRVVCQNTLMAALRGASRQKNTRINLRHTTHVNDRFVDAAEILGLATHRLREMNELFNALAEKPITHPLFQNYVKQLFPSSRDEENRPPTAPVAKHRDTVEELFVGPTNSTKGVRRTWLAAANAVVEYADHDQTTRKGSRWDHVMSPSAMNLKARAFELAVEMAKS